jgi:SNF2 family DNA or RNA helicase
MKPTMYLSILSDGSSSIHVRCSKSDKEEVKLAGNGSGRWNRQQRVWVFPADPVVVQSLRQHLPDIEVSNGIEQWLESLIERQNQILSALMNTALLSTEDKLYPFQRSAVRVLDAAGSLILGDEMGLGKTPISCSAIKYIGANRILIICPSQVKWSWVEHLETWAGITKPFLIEASKINSKRANIIWEEREIQILKVLKKKTFVIIMGFEMMKKYIKILLNAEYDLIIFDEAHRLKNRNAAVSKTALELTEKSKRNWLLTGTPVRNRHDDLFVLLSIVARSRFTDYWDFVNLYMDYFHNRYNQVEILGLLDEEAFNSMVSAYMLRRKKDEVMPELPAKIYTDLKIPLLPEQEEIYRTMEEEFCLYVHELTDFGEQFINVINAPNAITQLIRLRQICLAPSLLGYKDAKSAKLEVLADLLADLHEQGQRTIIFTYFRKFIKEVAFIIENIGARFAIIEGGQTANVRYRIQETLKDGNLDMVIGTAQSMGEGMNLQSATTAVFCDIDWVPANNYQAEDRIHRSGIKTSPNIIRLYHPNTVESDIWATCERKSKIIDEAIGSAEIIRQMMLRKKSPMKTAF